MSHEYYENPLIRRYASPEMSRLWGDDKKFRTWRQLWVWLAEAEAELGLAIKPEQIAELKRHVDTIDFAAAEAHERRLRHDVMAHIHAFGEQCPSARGIIHLGATSCYVTDNADLMLMRDGLRMLAGRLAAVIDRLGTFAKQHRDLACLGFTHLQPAQPTTFGKRACLWAYDLAMDLHELEHRLAELKARGAKGTTGTQASFLELFGGDQGKVKKLEEMIARRMGFEAVYPVTGQTYSRKVDAQVLSALSGIAQSAHKAATDIRLLASRQELDEPMEAEQVGSSAMAYKRNPMRSERICGLARFVISLETSTAFTAATQWLERTLDDSANRRLVLPQAFLAVDAILNLYENVAGGLVVYPQAIAKHLADELPFMATENILMAATAGGGDRQAMHERIRQHSLAAANQLKESRRAGMANDLVDRLKADKMFATVDFAATLDPRKFVGRAPQQVDEFLAEFVGPIRERYKEHLAHKAEVTV